jgi:hypothetical protein
LTWWLVIVFELFAVALNDSMDEMKKSAEFGLQHTPYIKIKLNSDVPRGQAILDMLQNLMQERNITNYKVRPNDATQLACGLLLLLLRLFF